ncbi:MAG: HEPN domain-containing protein [Lachnospiraceae bacterium]|nr:HEPN domain-containing protein [Lachnospiraceae bacterium]
MRTAHFNHNYVKEGIFPGNLSQIVRLASDNRTKADYLDFFVASKEEAEKQIERAKEFRSYVADYLKSQGIFKSEDEV